MNSFSTLLGRIRSWPGFFRNFSLSLSRSVKRTLLASASSLSLRAGSLLPSSLTFGFTPALVLSPGSVVCMEFKKDLKWLLNHPTKSLKLLSASFPKIFSFFTGGEKSRCSGSFSLASSVSASVPSSTFLAVALTFTSFFFLPPASPFSSATSLGAFLIVSTLSFSSFLGRSFPSSGKEDAIWEAEASAKVSIIFTESPIRASFFGFSVFSAAAAFEAGSFSPTLAGSAVFFSLFKGVIFSALFLSLRFRSSSFLRALYICSMARLPNALCIGTA